MKTKHSKREDGASLVEFALIAPLLVILLLGIVEFGWLFGQYNDVRHGAREGGRLAAVDGGTASEIAAYICDSMDLTNGGTVDIDLTYSGTGKIGDSGTVAVTAAVDSLSGAPIISSFLPSALSSTVSFRLEQQATWTSGQAGLSC